MKEERHYSPSDVDPQSYARQFDYILKEAMGAESVQDQVFVDSEIGPVLTSEDGTEYRVVVDNNGNLSTEEI